MKTTNLIYWTTTSILAVIMVFEAYSYLTQPGVQQGFYLLGFPGYFRKELAVAKLIGVVLLLTPVAAKVKEWTYAGLSIIFISDLIAHIVSGDPVSERFIPILVLGLLIISYISYQRRHTAEQNTLDPWQLVS